MKKEEVIEYAKNTRSAGCDKKYNIGKKDCIDGKFYTEEARYFMLCSAIRLDK